MGAETETESGFKISQDAREIIAPTGEFVVIYHCLNENIAPYPILRFYADGNNLQNIFSRKFMIDNDLSFSVINGVLELQDQDGVTWFSAFLESITHEQVAAWVERYNNMQRDTYRVPDSFISFGTGVLLRGIVKFPIQGTSNS